MNLERGNNKQVLSKLYDDIMTRLLDICNVHESNDSSWNTEYTDAEQSIIDDTKELINKGSIELYPMHALLCASNNWSTMKIVRQELYKTILKEGVEMNCLTPQNALAWDWIDIAAENNEPKLFMDDMEHWYDILATASEEGTQEVSDIAKDIMYRIWEPEQITEED